MSVERSFEAWEEVQRHSQDLADRLTQGFTGLIHSPPSFPWPNPQKPSFFDVEFEFPVPAILGPKDFGIPIDTLGIDGGVSAIFDIGNKIGQAGADFGACFNGLVQQFFWSLPLPFKHDWRDGRDSGVARFRVDVGGERNDVGLSKGEDLDSVALQLRGLRGYEDDGNFGGINDDELSWFYTKIAELFGRSQGSINISSTYDSRTQDLESSLTARGDLWRIEASNSYRSSNPGGQSSSLVLVQFGPVLFVRDTTLLLPVHLSKQHVLWYGYDRKNGLHSLCPAIWSKHRRWLLMSMICLNPLSCSFMDLQFPNGQLTYVAGEGLTTSAYLPIGGGLLQAQGQYPGEMKFSFSCKNKWGTRISPTIQWPDRAFILEVTQSLVCQQSGLIRKPTVQLSLFPTFGGPDPGYRAELIHNVKDWLSIISGCSVTSLPSAFTAVSLGRSKWNGNAGSSGVVVRVDAPLSTFGRPYFSVQLNSGIEF